MYGAILVGDTLSILSDFDFDKYLLLYVKFAWQTSVVDMSPTKAQNNAFLALINS